MGIRRMGTKSLNTNMRVRKERLLGGGVKNKMADVSNKKYKSGQKCTWLLFCLKTEGRRKSDAG